jgi:pyruvate dehydrogenase (quinone)
MAKRRVADVLVDVLADAGVRRIFGVSGVLLNGITDSIRATRKLDWIHLRHEETAAFAAGAKPISPEGWQFVPEVAVPEICT